MNSKTKKIVLIALPLLVVVVGLAIAFFVFNKPKVTTQSDNSEFAEAVDDLEAIPTVTADVKVSLESIQPKKEIKLVVGGVPTGTKSIEYELTYSTKDQDSQGVFSTASPDKGALTFGKDFERDITLGTCSKNVCKYHVITSPIKVSLKFEGSYGARIFQKEYDSASL